MAPSLGDARSTSATGFNLSPPGVGPLGTTSPLGSSYGLASSFNGGRHPSAPPPSQSQSYFDSFVANLSAQSVVNGPQPPPSASQISNSHFLAMENQRLRDENNSQRSNLATLEERFKQLLQVGVLFLCSYCFILLFTALQTGDQRCKRQGENARKGP